MESTRNKTGFNDKQYIKGTVIKYFPYRKFGFIKP